MAGKLKGFTFTVQSPPEGKCGYIRYKDRPNPKENPQRLYFRLVWPNLLICDDEDDQDGKYVPTLERGCVHLRPDLDMQYKSTTLYCVELEHTSLREGILNGGCGFLFFESVQERDDWFRILRRHTGHHRIQNVFQHATAAIGTGTYSRVMEGQDKTTSELKPVALKVLDKSSMSAADVRVLQDEIHVLEMVNRLKPRFCLGMLEWFECEATFVVVMPHMAGSDLLNRLRLGAPSFAEIEVQSIAKQVLTAISELHTHLICHKDIKPENILLTHTKPQAKRMRAPVECRLADFGIAGRIDGGNRQRCFKDGDLLRCSPGYGAPEVIRKEAYGQAVDVWSLGVVLYLMLTGIQPFIGADEGETRRKMTAASYDLEALRRVASPEAVDLVARMLVYPPEARISAAEALEHTWLRKLGTASAGPPRSYWLADTRFANDYSVLKMLWSVAVIWMGVLIARLHVVYYALGAGAVSAYFLSKDPNYMRFEFLLDFDEVGGGGQNVGASNSNCNSDSKADGACGEASSLKGGHLDSKKGS